MTTGWKITDDKAIPVRKCLGYFKTKTEGLQALIDYSNNGLPEKITFGQAVDKWYAENEKNWSDNTAKVYRTAINHLDPLRDQSIDELRADDFEKIMDTVNQSTLIHIKTASHGAYNYAMRHDYCNKDYSKLTRKYVDNTPKKQKVPFSREEIDALWQDGSEIANSVLVAIYSGWRWVELMNLKIEDDCMIGGVKTDAGKGRIVPIHHRIKPIVNKMYITQSYPTFRTEFNKLMEHYGMEHNFHETRHTTTTSLYGQDEHLVKLILGHTEPDLTKRVYTHNTIEQLRAVIETIV